MPSTLQQQEESFCKELQIFRADAVIAAAAFYSYLSIQMAISESRELLNAINESPTFWKVTIYSLEVSYFMALSRVFDASSRHNISRLVDNFEKNLKIFSRGAMRRRQMRGKGKTPEYLADLLGRVYEPGQNDVNRIRKHVRRYKGMYDASYRSIRNKTIAHRVIFDKGDVDKLFRMTKVREVERIVTFLLQVHRMLQETYLNGRKPVLRPIRYSINRIRGHKLPTSLSREIHEKVVEEVGVFCNLLSEKRRV